MYNRTIKIDVCTIFRRPRKLFVPKKWCMHEWTENSGANFFYDLSCTILSRLNYDTLYQEVVLNALHHSGVSFLYKFPYNTYVTTPETHLI